MNTSIGATLLRREIGETKLTTFDEEEIKKFLGSIYPRKDFFSSLWYIIDKFSLAGQETVYIEVLF